MLRVGASAALVARSAVASLPRLAGSPPPPSCPARHLHPRCSSPPPSARPASGSPRASCTTSAPAAGKRPASSSAPRSSRRLGFALLGAMVAAIAAANAGSAPSPAIFGSAFAKAGAFLVVSVALGVLIIAAPLPTRLPARVARRAAPARPFRSASSSPGCPARRPRAHCRRVAAGLVLEDLHFKPFTDRGEQTLGALIRPISASSCRCLRAHGNAPRISECWRTPSAGARGGPDRLPAVLGKLGVRLGVLRPHGDRLTIGLGIVARRGEFTLIFVGWADALLQRQAGHLRPPSTPPRCWPSWSLPWLTARAALEPGAAPTAATIPTPPCASQIVAIISPVHPPPIGPTHPGGLLGFIPDSTFSGTCVVFRLSPGRPGRLARADAATPRSHPATRANSLYPAARPREAQSPRRPPSSWTPAPPQTYLRGPHPRGRSTATWTEFVASFPHGASRLPQDRAHRSSNCDGRNCPWA